MQNFTKISWQPVKKSTSIQIMLNVTLFKYRLREQQIAGLFDRCPSFSCGPAYGRSQEMITDLPCLIQLLDHETGQHKQCPTDLCREYWTFPWKSLIIQKTPQSQQIDPAQSLTSLKTQMHKTCFTGTGMMGKSWNKNMDNIVWKQRLVLMPCHDFDLLFVFFTGTEFPVTTDLKKGVWMSRRGGRKNRKGKKKGKEKQKEKQSLFKSS